MRSLLLAGALALAICSIAPPAAYAAPPANQIAGVHAHVYLGKIDEAGAWQVRHFGNLPQVAFDDKTAVKIAPTPIVCSHGAKLHVEAAPTSEVAGRLSAGAKVTLVRVVVKYGYVWGEIDTGNAKVLALATRSYAIDGFTGRSGTAPAPAGTDNVSNLRNQGNRGTAAGPRARRNC